MVARNEAFLSIEGALTDKLMRAYRNATFSEIDEIARLIAEENFEEALILLDELDVTENIRNEQNSLMLLGLAAILFGAREFAPAGSTIFANEPPPYILNKAVENTTISAVTVVNETIKHRLKEKIHVEATSYGINRTGTEGFVKKLVDYAKGQMEVTASVMASLHTSRLASWGYLTQAESEGYTHFRVSEVLDNRTCPVCETMDGRIFTVERAKAKLEVQLSVDDPSQLKGMAPWPKQDKASVNALRSLSNEELAQAGWDTPPFHPLCRGVLVRI